MAVVIVSIAVLATSSIVVNVEAMRGEGGAILRCQYDNDLNSTTCHVRDNNSLQSFQFLADEIFPVLTIDYACGATINSDSATIADAGIGLPFDVIVRDCLDNDSCFNIEIIDDRRAKVTSTACT